MTKKQKILRLSVTAAALLVMTALIAALMQPVLRFLSEPEQFRAWMMAHGFWGAGAFVLLCMLQVLVAVIPAGPFSMAAGYAFGSVWGTVMCVLANTAAGALVFLAVRRWGRDAIRFLAGKEPEEIKLYQKLDKVEWLLFLVFLIPGSPKDILSYAAGLTRIKLSTWIAINLFGRIPGILLSTLGGDRLLSGNYLLTAVLSLACGAVYVLAMPVYNRYLEKRKNEP